MNKTLRLIVPIICLAIGAAFLIPFFIATWPKKTEPVLEINKTCKGSWVDVTAYDIKAFETPALKENNQILVVVGFEIKNTASQKDYYVGSCDLYVDDIAVSENLLNGVEKGAEQRLNATKLAPGKRTRGYVGANVPSGAQNLEVRIDDDDATGTSAVFILDSPPVESITPDEYFASLNG